MTMTGTLNNNPCVYVACLAAYNDGYLHGIWIDLTEGFEQAKEKINLMIKSSKADYAEEYAIHDSSGFCGYRVEEYSNIEELCTVAELIDQYEREDEGKGELISHLISDFGIDGAIEQLENNFIGKYDSVLDYAYEYVEDTGMFRDCSDLVSRYFDYESFARDLDYDLNTYNINGGTYIFNNY